MGHHHGIFARSFAFNTTLHGFLTDPFFVLVDLSADLCGGFGSSTPLADAVAGGCLCWT